MSRQAENGTQEGVLGLKSGLDALRRSRDFRGPVEPLDDHEHANDHFALIYESQEEQFAAVMPFIRQGLERGERCLYIADDRSRETVLEAMREYGIDADAALESGALMVQTKQDTYLRNGSFDPDDMIAFLADAVDDAIEEYEGLRVTGEMSWVFGDDLEIEDLLEYEGKLDTLFPDVNGIALCQYNRERFAPEIIRDVVRTHPHIIHDTVVSHNFYYTPPEEFFGPDQPANEVDRMLGTLHDRTEAKAELKGRQQFLRKQNEVTADPNRSFEEKLQTLFELGCERFDLELGAMARVDTDDDWFEVECVSDDHAHFEPGVELPLSETYCTAATEIKAAGCVSNPRAEGYDDIFVYQEFGIRAYLGTYVAVEGGTDRTFFFVSSEPREDGFSDDERAFLQLMGQWVQYELEHHRREQDQQTLYEIAANTDRTFDEKLQALFELGCERFDLELGGLARIEPETDLFEVESISGEHEHLEQGAQVDLSETYCRVLTADGETAGITNPTENGFDDIRAFEEFGVNAYLGTRIGFQDETDRTLFFVASEPRDASFSEAERTFLHLMGQWLQYELEYRQRERTLRETVDQLQQSNDRLKQFAYAASHDLQEPLRMISSYLQLLESQYGDELDEDAMEYIDFAVDGADRMRAMVDDLLAYSRVEQSDGELQPIDCETVLERVTSDLQVQIEESDAEIVADSLPTVRGNREQLEQLFSNLLSNAIKYSGDDTPHVEITARRRSDRWLFSVADDGIGIEREKTEKIFEVFKRLHHDDEYPGTGIGLSLCQEIVENHGGDIWVDSEPDAGSTFFFTLPERTAR
ncbi:MULTISPECIES: MEDS domain-containing protein [Natrialbaceae]|uniref:MEDS domain-containing protein n=1 Tax=Natrialbaceae TaxID=1644061 RepID=UPI00207C7E89|nr:MEDS domain-containing protein [Natronococcus sp. CG52]